MYKLCPFNTSVEAVDFATEQFILLCQEAIKERGRFTVAFSGGSTPKAIYKELTSDKNKHLIPWEKVFIFFSDERAVDENSPESNYKMAMDSGFSEIKGLAIFRLKGEEELKKAAHEYEKLILKEVPDGRFDLIMLGMGDDGHTASLFPDTLALDEEKKLIVPNFVNQLGVWRLTMTYPCIEKGKNVSIYILGSKKTEALQKVLEGPYDFKTLPLQKVILERKDPTFLITSKS